MSNHQPGSGRQTNKSEWHESQYNQPWQRDGAGDKFDASGIRPYVGPSYSPYEDCRLDEDGTEVRYINRFWGRYENCRLDRIERRRVDFHQSLDDMVHWAVRSEAVAAISPSMPTTCHNNTFENPVVWDIRNLMILEVGLRGCVTYLGDKIMGSFINTAWFKSATLFHSPEFVDRHLTVALKTFLEGLTNGLPLLSNVFRLPSLPTKARELIRQFRQPTACFSLCPSSIREELPRFCLSRRPVAFLR